MTEGGRAFDILSETDIPNEPDVLLFSLINPSVLVAGTYHLENDGRRSGSLLVYSLDPESFTCQLVHTVYCVSAVLDARWHIFRPKQLVVALSNGTIALYELSMDAIGAPQLRHIGDFQPYPNSTLVLSLAMDSTSALTVATLSTGHVSVVDVGMENATTSRVWKAHNLEVWCGAWKTSDTILTGGDDALLKVWDLRQDHQIPQMVCKSHDAGVVSILPISDTVFLTGSYDNSLRSFDYRNLKMPITSIDLDGGVWRILPRPKSSSPSLLVCCMQSGAKMVNTTQEFISFEQGGSFEPQEDNRLIYGGSWHSENIAALCSFYEKKLYICRIP